MSKEPPTKREARRVGRRRIGIVTVVLATGLLAAACSSNSSSSTTTTAAGSSNNGGATAPGVTATSITIGATTPLTGPAAPGYSEIAAASNPIFKWANANGGVNGRQINYIIKDDGYNPANTVTLTRQLVQQNNIFADVGSLGSRPSWRCRASSTPTKCPSCSSSGLEIAGRSPNSPGRSDGRRTTRWKGRFSASTSIRSSPARRWATSTRLTSSGRTSSKASTPSYRSPQWCPGRTTTPPPWPGP